MVYVIQHPKPGPKGLTYDISPALQFGQFKYIFEASDQPGQTPGPSKNKCVRALRNFDEDDYLLWAGGDPYALALATNVAAEHNQGRFKFLRWERERSGNTRTGRGYYVIVQYDRKQ
jgi:hypothetical protein